MLSSPILYIASNDVLRLGVLTTERINSQVRAFDIESLKVRNGRSAANLNTLIYLVINVRALGRAKLTNGGLLQMSQ